MMRKKILIITLCALLFVGLNLFLAAKDKSNKVERKTYVKDWEKVIERDMHEFLHKDGELVASEENQIYLEDSLGSFHEFLVNEGDQVQIGDGLYTYRIQNYYETKTHLERSIQVLESEITAIENAISTIQSSSSTPTFFDDEEFNFVSPADELLKDQYIAEKEKELAQKQAQHDSFDDQLTELQSTGDIVTVGSPYEGTVKSLSLSLTNPVLTIANHDLAVAAELSEEDRKKVELDMPVEIKVTDFPDSLEGSISTVNEFPNEQADDNGSAYDFTVTFNEDANTEGLLPGFHTQLKITTNESLQTPSVKYAALDKNSTYKMTNEGTLLRQKVELGIKENQRYEVVSGLANGDFIAHEGKRELKSGDKFVTPLKHKKVSYHKIKDSNQTLRNKHIILGLLSR